VKRITHGSNGLAMAVQKQAGKDNLRRKLIDKSSKTTDCIIKP